MGCPTESYIGETLTFSICTHDPDTGVLTDADAAPIYWIYEDETGTSINASSPGSDVMAKLDDGQTVGLYSETVTISAANGYENGKSYTIYIKATVDSDTGGISYGFKARTDLLDVVLADLADNSLNSGEDITPRKALRALFNRFFREVTQTATAQVVKNDSGTQVATMVVSDDATTQTKGIAT
ncbi:MAG TPA: hypothetical protein VMZ04_05700 [Anaerolineae bacterium]|nr:hypothetical protein [Anaerolineae bacterium]